MKAMGCRCGRVDKENLMEMRLRRAGGEGEGNPLSANHHLSMSNQEGTNALSSACHGPVRRMAPSGKLTEWLKHKNNLSSIIFHHGHRTLMVFRKSSIDQITNPSLPSRV